MSTRLKTVWGIGILLGFILLGCDKEQPHTSAGPEALSPVVASGAIRFEVSFAPWPIGHAKLTAIQTIDAARAYVYNASGAEVMHQDLTLSENRASGRIAVPAQDNLRVVLVYFDGSIARYIGEDTAVDVPAGGEAAAEIVAEYMGSLVSAPDGAEVGETYTVSWMDRPFATEYELQEATGADFSGAVTHTGADTFKVISGKNTAGTTFYYRVRVKTDYGYGPWHSTGSASIGIHATGAGADDGVIVVDVPVPPDEPDEKEKELVIALPDGATMEMVWIEPGTFRMGGASSEPGYDADENPIHEVTISHGFYLGKCEITQEQWEAVVGTAPWFNQQYRVLWASQYSLDPFRLNTIFYSYDSFKVKSDPNHPAVSISWVDMQVFIHEMNVSAGDSLYRLPTEAEWEYACRAGTSTAWSFGNDEGLLKDYADSTGANSVHQVGTKLPNPWGLYDMLGNVYEWCQDWYGSYLRGSQVNPTGPLTGSNRVLRGGAFGYTITIDGYFYFIDGALSARSANRKGLLPDGRDINIGARLLRIK